MATWAKGIDFKNSNNTSRIGGIGIYGTDSTINKLYIGLGVEPWNNAGLQLTSSAINFKGNKIYHAGDKPTASEIGAAASSHTHSYLPLSGGTMTGTLALKPGGSTLTGTGIATGNTQLIGTTTDTIYFGNPKTKIILESNSTPSVSVNGTIYTMYHTGNKPTASEIGAAAASHTHNYAAASHTHGLLHDTMIVEIPSTTTDNGWSMLNSSYNGFLLKSIRTNAKAPSWILGDYSAGIVFGGADTKGVLSMGYGSPTIKFAGGNGTKPVWNMALTGSSGKTYNMESLSANTATKLATARTINGTSFNGSANITTANWGTARTITIGNTGKSVNGSGNVSWSLSEIGAAPTSHNHTSLSSVSNISLTSGLKIKPGGDRGVSFETTEGKSITLSAHGDFTGLRYITADTINDYNIGATPTRNKGCIPVIGSDSVMEIGKYIDFHTDESSTDYHLRVDGGPDCLKLNFRNNIGWLGFYRPDGNRWGYVGCGSTANSNFIVNADIGHLTLHASATGGAISFYPQSKYVYTDANSVPDKDNTYYLGTTSPARRWKQLCAVTASIATSDSNYKTKIEPIINEDEPMVISNLKNVHNPKAFSQTINTEKATKSDYYEFIRDRFKPYSYEYIINDINGCEDEFSEEDKLKCAKSIGFVADEYDLENDKVAREFIFETSDGILNYNTGNYITVIAIALKESINKIEILEYENQQLKEKLSAIEQKLGLE